jgi:hypothetical protein
VVNAAAKGLVALALLGGAAPVGAALRYEGDAFDAERGTLLYREQHLLRGDGDGRERLVLYRCADGGLFARKRVAYGTRPAAPEFVLDDGRFGYREGVRRDGDATTVFVRENAAAAERSEPLALDAGTVIDAGFDEFVRTHWDALRRGETRALDFVVPSRLEALAFRLRHIGATQVDGEPASAFRLALGGVLGWFAPDIDVVYRDRDRRLMRFEGLTNIRADRDDNLVARIEFPPQREQPGLDPAAWEAALAEPLSTCEPGRG